MSAQPPNDLAAERYTLAGMLNVTGGIEQAVEAVEELDFYRGAHQELFRAMVVMWAGNHPVDPVSLRDYINREVGWAAFGGESGGTMMIAELVGIPTAGPGYHARIVRDKSIRRKMIEVGMRVMQLGSQADFEPDEAVSRAEVEIQHLTRMVGEVGSDTPMSMAEFMRRDWKRLPPVIPGLLDHEDRIIIVGGEGHGKTTLAWQAAIAAAIGVHPFETTYRFAPQKVLIVDLENPRAHVHRELRKFNDVAQMYGAWPADNLIIWTRPGGIDLKRAADSGKLASVIRHAKPDLVVAGPIYKMLRDRGEGAEQLHSQVTGFWDEQRDQYGFALWLETHAPKGQQGKGRALEPLGSSIYLRWPEFGYGLAKVGDTGDLKWVPFRGDRELGRRWPIEIQRNPMPRPCWPWVPKYAAGILSTPLWPTE